MSEVQFVGGVMTDTVTALESLARVIDINLFYCFNLWGDSIKLQGHYKPETILLINRRLKREGIEVTWAISKQGYGECKFMYNERQVAITLT